VWAYLCFYVSVLLSFLCLVARLLIHPRPRLLSRVASPGETLPYLVPILVARLGQKDIIEETEEIRKLLLAQVGVVLQMCGEMAGVYIDELVQILARTVVDPFPDVKKVAHPSHPFYSLQYLVSICGS